MRDESWYKWFLVAMLIHALILGVFSLSIKRSPKKLDIPYYSVNLVGDIGNDAAPAPPKEKATPVPLDPTKAEPKKAKPLPQPKEKERPISTTKELSLTPAKKKEVPESTTKDDVRRLNERIRQMSSNDSTANKIREMKQRIRYVDVAAGGKGDAPGPKGGSTQGDSAMAKYQAEVWEKISSAWRPPIFTKGDLQTLVWITIRKDGHITDWQIDERSGNRVYDETVARALKSVNDLPPIPPSLHADSVEIGFAFHPPAGVR
ncbi:MAG: TonB family protein [Syntrophorhabdales bacterium]|jgi:TonB family protein